MSLEKELKKFIGLEIKYSDGLFWMEFVAGVKLVNI